MPEKRTAPPGYPQELSFDDLRRLIVERRRAQRKARLNDFLKHGKIQPVPEQQSNLSHGSTSRRYTSGRVETGIASALPRKKTWFDRLLLGIEISAVLGLLVILYQGYLMLSNLNRNVSSALIQPTLTPTAIISAVILPSGHTPPNSPQGVQPNQAEIPEHLQPLVQSLAQIPVPTAGPQQAVRIQIPSIEVDAPVVQGDGWEQLKKGVGQHVGSPDPGEDGNIVLSAHNDIFGEIFKNLDRLKPGDEIILFTSTQTHTYTVNEITIVEPTQIEVMAPSQNARTTLISCYPYMVDNQRIVVKATLQE